MSYHVYENPTEKKAVILSSTCSFCNSGAGVHGTAGNQHGCWHGLFATIADARAAAFGTGQPIKGCHYCAPA
jgi:hypothetical protein